MDFNNLTVFFITSGFRVFILQYSTPAWLIRLPDKLLRAFDNNLYPVRIPHWLTYLIELYATFLLYFTDSSLMTL